MKFLSYSLLTTLLSVAGLRADTPEQHALALIDQQQKRLAAEALRENEPALDSFVRVNATLQSFNAGQPWQRNNPTRRSGLGTLLSPTEILTVAELVADHTYLELESADATESVQAEVIAIDYQANLALLRPVQEADFLARKQPLELAPPAKIGDTVTVWQFENNGTTLQTSLTIRAADTSSTFLPGNPFLTYILKGSMQSASSSFTLPTTHHGKFLGVLTSYDSNDQISEVIAPEIIASFLRDARDGSYEGFPSLGCVTQNTKDKSFRQFLQLPANGGGLYLSKVRPNSPAAQAGLQQGDVLLAVDGHELDRRGYFQHPAYGPLPWTVLIRGEKTVGDSILLTTLRAGARLEATATLGPAEPPLVPRHIHDSPPPFLIKGGLVFQELSRAYLEAFGENWSSRAPLPLMHAMDSSESYEESRDRIVFLARVIPNPATIGYDQLGGLIVEGANGQTVRNLAELADLLREAPANGIHAIDLADAPGTLYLDATLSDQVDQQLLQQGLSNLSRLP